MIRILESKQAGRLLSRRAARFGEAEATVRPILDAVRTRESGLQRFGATQIRRDDFIGEVAMLARIASQRAYFELTLGL